jgi:hypothetical protein
MDRTTTRHVRTFAAFSEGGKEHAILVFQTSIESLDSKGARQNSPEIPRLQTRDGQIINRIEKGQYEIVGDPMIPLTSTDPKAF